MMNEERLDIYIYIYILVIYNKKNTQVFKWQINLGPKQNSEGYKYHHLKEFS